MSDPIINLARRINQLTAVSENKIIRFDLVMIDGAMHVSVDGGKLERLGERLTRKVKA